MTNWSKTFDYLDRKEIFPLPEQPLVNQPKPVEPDDKSEFGKGWKAGLYQTAAVAPAVVSMAGKAVGADSVAEWGAEKAGGLMEKASEYEGETSFEELIDSPTLEGATNWFLHTAGTVAPSMIIGMTGAGIGAKALGGLALKKMSKSLIANKAKGLVAEGVAKDVAVKLAAKQLASKAVKYGAAAGIVATTAPQEAAHNFMADVEQHGIENASPGKAALTGTAAGLVELGFGGGHLRLINKVLGVKAGKVATKELSKLAKIGKVGDEYRLVRMLKEAVIQGGGEGLQELTQEELSILNEIWTGEDQSFFEKKNLLRAGESFAAGAVMGVPTGGVTGVFSKASVDNSGDTTGEGDTGTKVKGRTIDLGDIPGPDEYARMEASMGEDRGTRTLDVYKQSRGKTVPNRNPIQAEIERRKEEQYWKDEETKIKSQRRDAGMDRKDPKQQALEEAWQKDNVTEPVKATEMAARTQAPAAEATAKVTEIAESPKERAAISDKTPRKAKEGQGVKKPLVQKVAPEKAAEVKVGGVAVTYNPTISRVDKNRGNGAAGVVLMEESGLSTELPVSKGDDILYRGMSKAEYENVIETGKIASHGKGDFVHVGHEGQTSFVDDPVVAGMFAHGGSPRAGGKPSVNEPAYIIGVKTNAPKTKRPYQYGVKEATEYGVAGEISASEIVSVTESNMYAIADNITIDMPMAERIGIGYRALKHKIASKEGQGVKKPLVQSVSYKASKKVDSAADVFNTGSSSFGGGINSVTSSVKKLGNIRNRLASLNHSFSDLDVKTKRNVQSIMVDALHQPEVRNAVIKSIPVNVVDDFISFAGILNGPADMFFHNGDVLLDPNIINTKNSIPTGVYSASSLLDGIARLTTSQKETEVKTKTQKATPEKAAKIGVDKAWVKLAEKHGIKKPSDAEIKRRNDELIEKKREFERKRTKAAPKATKTKLATDRRQHPLDPGGAQYTDKKRRNPLFPRSKKPDRRQNITMAKQVAAEFKRMGFGSRVNGDSVRVSTPTGNIAINIADSVVGDDSATIRMAYGKEAKPGEKVVGSYFDGEIKLKRNKADRFILSHELFHHMKAAGLFTAAEEKILSRKGSEEAQARWVERQLRNRGKQSSVVRKLIKKIADFLDALANVFVRTERGVLRDVESGRILKRSDPKNISGPLTKNDIRKPSAKGVVPPPANKSLSNGIGVAVKNLSKSFVPDTGVLKPFSSLDVVGQRDVLAMMRTILKDRKVLDSVVRLVPIDVVNMLSGKKISPKVLLDNPSMLVDLLPTDPNDLIPSGVRAVDILAPVSAINAAKVVFGTSVVHVSSKEILSAIGTDKIGHDSLLSIVDKIPHPNEYVNQLFNEDAAEINEHIQYATAVEGEQYTLPLTNMDKAKSVFNRKFNDAMYWIVDKNYSIDVTQKKLGELTDKINVFLKETQRPKITAAKVEKFWEDEVQPLIKKMARYGVNVEDLELYSHAKHVIGDNLNQLLRERNAKIQVEEIIGVLDKKESKAVEASVKGVKAPADWLKHLEEIFDAHKNNEDVQMLKAKWDKFAEKPSGMTDKDAKAVLKQYEGDEKIEELRKMMLNINKGRLDLLFDAGQIPKEEYDRIVKKYKYYVPLYREGYDDSMFGTTRGLKPSGRQVKVRGGSTRNVVNIFANTVANYEKAINISEKAVSQRALYGLAKANIGSETLTIRPVKKSPRTDKNGNIRMYPNLFEVEPNEMRIMVDGKQYLIEVNKDDKDAMLMMRTLKADDGMNGPIVNFLARINRFLARINTTWSPEFIISNFLRDFGTANINIRDTGVKGENMFSGARKAIVAILAVERGKRKGTDLEKMYDRFKAAGGKIGWADVHGSVENLSKKITREIEMQSGKRPTRAAIKGWLELIDNANTAIENGIRLHTFKLATEQGKTDERAAQIASDLTVDFTKKGAAGPVINSLYLFANAGIQGSYRILRASIKSRSVQKVLAGIVGTSFVVGILNSMAGEDEDGEDYFNKIDDFVRERNMIFMIPGTKGKYAKIPAPWGYNLFWNIGSELSRAVTKENFSAMSSAGRLISIAAGAFNPVQSGTLLQTLSPTVADPFVMVSENKNWFGGDLMPAVNKFERVPTPDSQRYWKSASSGSKWVAGALNKLTRGDKIKSGAIDVSPETLDLILDTAGGSALRFFKDSIGVPLAKIRGEEIEAHKIPFYRRVAGDQPAWANSRIYYENIENVLIAKERLKAYKGTVQYKNVLIATKDLRKMMPLAEQSEKRLRKLRKSLKAAEVSGDKDRVETIKKRMNAVYNRFNKFYNKEK